MKPHFQANQNAQEAQPKKRIGFLDELRGFAIICMVFHHLGFDLVSIFGIDIGFIMYSWWMNLLHYLFAGAFVFMSGAACRLSHNNLKRGLLCLGCGLSLIHI